MPDKAELRDRVSNLEAEALMKIEQVTQAALLHASDKFITDPADPGWGAELHEEMLYDAIKEAASAINLFETAKRELQRRSLRHE